MAGIVVLDEAELVKELEDNEDVKGGTAEGDETQEGWEERLGEDDGGSLRCFLCLNGSEGTVNRPVCHDFCRGSGRQGEEDTEKIEEVEEGGNASSRETLLVKTKESFSFSSFLLPCAAFIAMDQTQSLRCDCSPCF